MYKFNDGDSDFEKKIAELNIRSNNAGVVNIYSLGIDRNKTENGIEDTLNLVIPPLTTDTENKEALALYKKKSHSEETAKLSSFYFCIDKQEKLLYNNTIIKKYDKKEVHLQ